MQNGIKVPDMAWQTTRRNVRPPALNGNPDILTRVCRKVLSNKKNTHEKRATKYRRIKRFVTAVSKYKIVVQF